MERRLIFFSGGMDSVALLSLSKPEDIIVTVVDTPGNAIANWFGDVDKNKTEKIAKYYNRTVYYYPVHIPYVEIEEGHGVHQTNIFFSVANNWARIKGKSLKEVWWGVYASEYNQNLPLKKVRDAWFKSWDILHPDIKFYNPLGHLTKGDVWQMIPDELKGLTSPCRQDPIGDWRTCNCQKCVIQRQATKPGAYTGAWKRFKMTEGEMKDKWIVYDPSGEVDLIYHQT